MGAESGMRSRVMKALNVPEIHPIAIETNGMAPGTPDINHVYGWLELKQLPEWPVREDTVVRVPTYTPYQRLWQKARIRAGGLVQILLRVGSGHNATWILMSAAWAIAHLSVDATKSDVVEQALQVWYGILNEEELRWAIQKQ